MHLKERTCTKCAIPHKMLNENGYFVCEHCGHIGGRCYETELTSFAQSFRSITPTYSRRSRFDKKMLAALRCRNNYTIDTNIITWLRTLTIETPEALICGIASYQYANTKKRRRPYMYVTYYWRALKKRVPVVSDFEVRRLLHDFDAIFFAWRRLGLPNPEFPYAYLFRKIVASNDYYSPQMRYLTRFVRKLCCPRRRARYDTLYDACAKNIKLSQLYINDYSTTEPNTPTEPDSNTEPDSDFSEEYDP